ncbi:hypothetical protein D3C87_894210 [compost metagenome]
MSMHERTICLRSASVAEPTEKFFDQLQPPSEMNSFRFGCAAFSFLNCRKLPDKGASQGIAWPSTVRFGVRM